MAFYYNHIDVFFTLILPFCIIVTLNTLICRTVHQLAHVRRTMTLTTRRRFTNGRHNSRRSSDGYPSRSLSHRTNANSQSKVTHMLLVVSTVFICLNLPSYILRLWLYVNEVRIIYYYFSFYLWTIYLFLHLLSLSQISPLNNESTLYYQLFFNKNFTSRTDCLSSFLKN